jgi:hypothetical protein
MIDSILIKQLKLENLILRTKMLKILESKPVLSIEEYDLYLYLCDLEDKQGCVYPKLPDSDSEGDT